MRDEKRKHLRWKGNQWQFCKRYPKDIAAIRGKQFFIANLGTADLIQAQKIRARKIVEFNDLCDALLINAQNIDAEIAQQLRDMPEGCDEGQTNDRDTLLLYLEDLAEKRKDGKQWFRAITGLAVPLDQSIDRFIRECHAADTTQKARRSAVRRLESWLIGKRLSAELEAVTKKVAGEFTSHLCNQKLAGATVNSIVQHLSSYWRWMVKRGIVRNNPWAGQQIDSEITAQKREIWEPEEIARLLNEAPSDVLLHAMAVAVLSGLRAAEIARLTVGDCKDGLLVVRQGKTASAARSVPIHSQLAAIIAARSLNKGDDDFIFPDFRGKAKELVKRFSRHRTKLFGRSGVRQASKTFHSFRHTFITLRLRAGCSEAIVRSVVGHKLKGVTLSVYHHGFTLDQLREVVEAVRVPIALKGAVEQAHYAGNGKLHSADSGTSLATDGRTRSL